MTESEDQLQETIQEVAIRDQGRPVVVTGWALVAELMDETGERWLARMWAENTTQWGAKGMWIEAVHGPGNWPMEEED